MSRLLKALPSNPSLRIDALSLWVLGREFPDSRDTWDGNWLRVVATCVGAGSRVEVSGPILDTASFAGFLSQLEVMATSLSGSAELSSLEPELKLVLQYSDAQSHIEGKLEITADHLRESHSFALTISQKSLPEIIRQLQDIMAAFPPRGLTARDA